MPLMVTDTETGVVTGVLPVSMLLYLLEEISEDIPAGFSGVISQIIPFSSVRKFWFSSSGRFLNSNVTVIFSFFPSSYTVAGLLFTSSCKSSRYQFDVFGY